MSQSIKNAEDCNGLKRGVGDSFEWGIASMSVGFTFRTV